MHRQKLPHVGWIHILDIPRQNFGAVPNPTTQSVLRNICLAGMSSASKINGFLADATTSVQKFAATLSTQASHWAFVQTDPPSVEAHLFGLQAMAKRVQADARRGQTPNPATLKSNKTNANSSPAQPTLPETSTFLTPKQTVQDMTMRRRRRPS